MEIQGTWVRGGTSKCWVFEAQEIEALGVTTDEFLPRVYGSPDHRQLDGVGGGTSTTSKAIILSPPEDDDIDVVFAFGQVGVEEFKVDWGSNCGNCSTSAGLYAVENGWVELQDGVTYVTTFNSNTSQKIIQRIPTPGGSLPDIPVGHMPGTVYAGHEVGLGFVDPGGKTTGNLTPAGAKTTLNANGRDYVASLVDAGAPVVMLTPDTLGLDQVPYAYWTDRVKPLLTELDHVRRAGAVAMGMVASPGEAERAVPKLGIVGPSATGDSDLDVLMLSMGNPHPAMPITASVAVTMAAFTPGTYPYESASRGAESGKLRLMTPAGAISTVLENRKGSTVVSVERTARTLAKATLYLPD